MRTEFPAGTTPTCGEKASRRGAARAWYPGPGRRLQITSTTPASPAGLVGQVIQAWSNGAKVRTLIDPKFGVTVMTTARPGAPVVSATAQGDGANTLKADFDAGTKLRLGDEVYTSAQSPSFPANIPVGKIVKFGDSPGSTSVHAEIEPFVNLNELTYLTVLRWHPGSGAVLDLPTTTTTSTTTSVPFNPFGVTTTLPSTFPPPGP